MKKILLIITNDETRQVYHEILLTKKTEVVPVIDISTAIIISSLDDFSYAIMEIDKNIIEAEIFLRLRQKYSNLSKIKFILIIKNKKFKPTISKNDIVFYNTKTSIQSIIAQIEKE